MKLIKIICINSEEGSKILKNHKNSLLSFTDNKWYFHSHYHLEKEEILIEIEKISFEIEKWEKFLEKIIKRSIIEAKEISNENLDYNEEELSDLKKGLLSIINKYSYKSEKELNNENIFNFFAEILIRILLGHYLDNGNKRIGLTILTIIMYSFGYYLKWSKNARDIYKGQYEKFLMDCISKSENRKNQKGILFAENYIRQNTVIANKFVK